MPRQAIGGKKVILLRKRRFAAVDAEIARLHEVHAAHAALASAQPKAAACLARFDTLDGSRYGIAGCRCEVDCYVHDCSGGVIMAVNAEGLQPQYPCVSSFAIAQFMRDHNTLTSEATAINTVFGIGIENAWGSPSWQGANGHVVAFMGDGQHTMECKGHAYGCLHDRATGRGFNAWGHFPGVDYSTAPPPPVLERQEMLTFICPNKPVDAQGNTPHAEFWPAGQNPFLPHGGFIMHWGASIASDTKWASKDDPHQRMLLPAKGATWIGAAARGTDGVMVVNAAGHTSGAATFVWS